MSYYLDYTAQCTEGNFTNLYIIRVDKELNELVGKALALVGAEKHLELFQQQSKKKSG
jgi:hypothetical protein